MHHPLFTPIARTASLALATALLAGTVGTQAASAATPTPSPTPVETTISITDSTFDGPTAAPLSSTTATLVVTALRNDATQVVGVRDIVFTLAPVQGIDLTTTDGWALAATYTGGQTSTTPRLGSPVVLRPTNQTGTTSVTGMPFGLYRLSAPGFTTAYVVLPQWDADSRSWQTEVAAYPKHTGTVPPGQVAPPTEAPTPTPGSTTPAVTVSPTAEPTTTTSTTEPAIPVGHDSTGAGAGAGSVAAPGGSTDSLAARVTQGLAYTGAELTGPVGIALAALLVGGGLLLAGRRRREDSTNTTSKVSS